MEEWDPRKSNKYGGEVGEGPRESHHYSITSPIRKRY
jgi:hypothetical protein